MNYPTFFVLLATILLFACNPSQQPSESVNHSQTAMKEDSLITEAPSSDPTKKAYVIAPSGLNLRVSESPQSQVITVIPYGYFVLVLASENSEPLRIENIEGKMMPVLYQEEEGYVFDGFLVNVPVPDISIERRDSIFSEYIKSLKTEGFPIKSQIENQDEMGTYSRSISLPLVNIEAAFLIAKQLFFIPASYSMPLKSDTMTSPENPGLEAENSPYDYLTQSFEVSSNENGEISEIRYIHQSEVGAQWVSIKRLDEGTFELTDSNEGF